MSASAEVGTCALCGQEMIRTAEDCWHPHGVERPCPPEPGPMAEGRENFDAWQEFRRQGLRPGRPGREHFVATPEDVRAKIERSSLGTKHLYSLSGRRVTADEFAATMSDLFAQGWTLTRPNAARYGCEYGCDHYCIHKKAIRHDA